MRDSHDDGLECVANRRKVLKLLGCAGVVLAALVLGSKTELARAGANDTSVITGTEEDALFTEGCTSPIGYCARGTFKGDHGFKGASGFTGLAFDPIPDDPLGRQSVPGMSTFTTSDGQITVSDVTVFDTGRGTFAGVGRIVEGTGTYAGATGNVFTYGHAFAGGSFFTTFVIELSK